jgi:hypothetical protein
MQNRLQRRDWLQENVADLCGSAHGIKVLLSLLSNSDKHLPPHATALLHPAERHLSVAVQPVADASVTPATTAQRDGIRMADGTSTTEASQASTGSDAEQNASRAAGCGVEGMHVLGLSKKDAQTRRAELIASGNGSLGRALLSHCTSNIRTLMCSAHGAQLTCDLACGEAVGALLWNTEQAAVIELHEAVARAAGEPAREATETGEAAGAAFSRESLIENLFASRALRRMVQHRGCAADHFAKTLWELGLRRQCAVTMQSHGAKILASLADSTDAKLQKDVRHCIEQSLDAGTVDQWLQTFQKQ